MTEEHTIEGEYTDAVVKIGEIEDLTLEQVQEMVNQEAFTEPVRIMPDAHPGSGSVVGFTMPIGDKVVPNTIGVDIGCGMFAAHLPGNPDIHDWDHRQILDNAIREKVPVGRDTHAEGMHMHNDFPYAECQAKLDTFNHNSDFEDIDVEYDPDYYDGLISRIDTSFHRASNSVGTLGGGNHFIEIGEAQRVTERDSYHMREPYWMIIHSGSRHLGLSVCHYWQNIAAKKHDDRADEARDHLKQFPPEYVKFDIDNVSDGELLDWLHGGMGEDFVNYEEIPREERERVKNSLKKAVPEGDYDGTPYDWLDGEDARGYIRDMIFAQTYASINRRKMAEYVLEAWYEQFFEGYFKNPESELPPELVGDELEFIEIIESVHNYIDFEDQIIRKGATRAHEDEKAVVPYNMADGTIIVEGKGNEDWNFSVNHGAGRVDSRGWAGNEVTQEEVNKEIEQSDVFASIVPRDEAPHSYKNWKSIEEAMDPAADIVNRIEPLMNIKAETRYYDET